MVDVAHEALIRHWSLLRKWVNESREYLTQKRKIEAAASEWQSKLSRKDILRQRRGSAKDYLLRGKALTDAKVLQKKLLGDLELSELAEEFIQVSIWQQRINRLKSIGLFGLAIIIVNSVSTLLTPRTQPTYRSSIQLLVEPNVPHQEKIEAIERIVKNGWSFTTKNLSYQDFSDANLSHAVFSGFNFSGANLSRAYLRNANLSGANLSRAELTGANLSGANLRGTNLKHANLSNANLGYGSDNDWFIRREMWSFSRANRHLQKSYFSSNSIRILHIDSTSDVNLGQTNQTELRSSDLTKADLSYAYLINTDLSSANLNSAILRNADLSSANLNSAILRNADLRNIDLRIADLSGANLSGANLNSAKNLTPEQVKSAKNWEKAKYDEEFRAKLGLPPQK